MWQIVVKDDHGLPPPCASPFAIDLATLLIQKWSLIFPSIESGQTLQLVLPIECNRVTLYK